MKIQEMQSSFIGAGRRCRIITGEPAPGETIQHRYFFKPSHVDLLLSTIGPEGLSGKPAAALADAIVQAAATLGACPNSRCSILSESDSTVGYEQVFSPLEYRSDAASAAKCAGLRAERPCLPVYR